MALASRHPLAKAIVEAAGCTRSRSPPRNFPARAVSADHERVAVRLGSVAWCAAEREAAPVAERWPDASLIALNLPGRAVVFAVRQALRPDAAAVVAELARDREVEILSGDREPAVALVARELGVTRYAAGVKPAGKIARLRALKEEGCRPLMVGDGLNDAPALAAAYVSISPISAAHVAQAQADALFLGERLSPVVDAVRISTKARRLMVQNLWLSAIYNAIAVPARRARLRDAADCGARDVRLLGRRDAQRVQGARRRGDPPDECSRLSRADRAGAGLLGLAAFLWALKSGQFDDLDGAGWRAISDDDLPEDKRD